MMYGAPTPQLHNDSYIVSWAYVDDHFVRETTASGLTRRPPATCRRELECLTVLAPSLTPGHGFGHVVERFDLRHPRNYRGARQDLAEQAKY